jgi:hypothetical protein
LSAIAAYAGLALLASIGGLMSEIPFGIHLNRNSPPQEAPVC